MDSSNSLLCVFSTDFGDRKIKEVSHKSRTNDFEHHDST